MHLEAQARQAGGIKLVNASMQAVEQLARALIAEGFAPLRRLAHPDEREILVWGILSLACSPRDGAVRARLLNEPADAIYQARHEKWAGRITACDPLAEELAGIFCSWQVRKRLGIYGSTGEAAAKALKARLGEASGMKSIGSAWRAAFCRWLLDPDVSRLARKAYGPDFTLAEYHRIFGALPLARQVEKETPSLLPALAWILAAQASPRKDEIEAALFGRSEIDAASFFHGLRRALLRTYGKTVLSSSPQESLESEAPGAARTEEEDELLDALGDLPFGHDGGEVLEGRLSKAGWKLLVQLPGSAVRTLFEPRAARIPYALQALEYFAAAGIRRAPAAAIKAFARNRAFHELTGGFPRWVGFAVVFMREVGACLESSRPLRPLLEGEFPATVDWLAAEGVARGYPRSNAIWASLQRHQSEWHRNPAGPSRVVQNASWHSEVGHASISGCEAVPLCSAKELIAEGARMEHCVGVYWRACLGGRSRMFSLSSSQGRSTLELAQRDGCWQIAQHRGFRNAPPPVDHPAVAREVLRRYRQAAAILCPDGFRPAG